MRTSGIRCLIERGPDGPTYTRIAGMPADELKQRLKFGRLGYCDPTQFADYVAPEPKPEPTPAPVKVVALPKPEAPAPKPFVEKVKDAVVKAVSAVSGGSFTAGDRVVTKRKGKEVSGTVLTVAGGKDKGKVRIAIDGDTAKYRECKIADTRKVDQ